MIEEVGRMAATFRPDDSDFEKIVYEEINRMQILLEKHFTHDDSSAITFHMINIMRALSLMMNPR
jgi:hypothetical protein